MYSRVLIFEFGPRPFAHIAKSIADAGIGLGFCNPRYWKASDAERDKHIRLVLVANDAPYCVDIVAYYRGLGVPTGLVSQQTLMICAIDGGADLDTLGVRRWVDPRDGAAGQTVRGAGYGAVAKPNDVEAAIELALSKVWGKARLLKHKKGDLRKAMAERGIAAVLAELGVEPGEVLR